LGPLERDCEEEEKEGKRTRSARRVSESDSIEGKRLTKDLLLRDRRSSSSMVDFGSEIEGIEPIPGEIDQRRISVTSWEAVGTPGSAVDLGDEPLKLKTTLLGSFLSLGDESSSSSGGDSDDDSSSTRLEPRLILLRFEGWWERGGS